MSTIYLLDDHAIVRDGLRAMLEAAGYRVVGESGNPTVALAEVVQRPPALLLVDIGLGSRSGFELLAELQARQLPVRSLVLTMSAQPHHVAQALRLGATGYLLKGAPRAELLRAVHTVLRGQRYLGSGLAALVEQMPHSAPEADLLARLSPRECQIITMVVGGRTSPEIGQQLHLSHKTVDTYRGRLMAKLGVGDITALVRFAIRNGLIDADGN